ncbi:MAG: sulfopyruvate decarboxylase TPP-binding subunit [Arenicella sp.]|jgi:sulfopyruvate decarboxylase TPP-binding subunit
MKVWGLCDGAHMGGKRPCIVMQNTAIGVTINTLATLFQYYNIPLPMLISYRGEIGERVACQVEMAVIVCRCESGNIPVPVIEYDAPVIKYRFMQEVKNVMLDSSALLSINI